MKNSDVINKILKYHPQFPGNYAGCDGYKFGDPNAECNGIATALVPTVDVIRRTGELGAICWSSMSRSSIQQKTTLTGELAARTASTKRKRRFWISMALQFGVTMTICMPIIRIQYLQVLSSTLVGKTIIFLQKKVP